MKIDNVGINVDYFKDKPFEVFEKAMKGKLRSDKIKPAYDSFKVTKPKKVEKPKEVKDK
jgi:hypothetical protein